MNKELINSALNLPTLQPKRKQTPLQLPHGRLANLCVSKRWAEKNPTLSDLRRNYSPNNWAVLSRLGNEVYTRECPALGALPELYGDATAPEQWIDDQVTGMFISSSSRDASLGDGIAIFAANFAQSVRVYKLTELMLFFSRYKAGCYDNSYYAFDPRRIGIAFHKEFLQERNKAIAKIEMEQASNREVSSNGMSREEYDKETTFRHHVQILKDSPELRKYINIVSEVTSDGKATSVLPKEQLPRIAQCVQKEYIAVL